MTKIIENSTILITGADGGIGSAMVRECIQRGAKKIYATGISLDKLKPLAEEFPKVIVPLELNVTDEQSIKKAVAVCGDVNILINNAGVELKSSFIGEDAAKKALFEMQVNYIGVIALTNSFLEILKANSKSYIINILSVGSSAVVKRLSTYCASKAATHLVTQTIREELKAENIEVVGVYPGYVNTEMTADLTIKKAAPADLASSICNGFEKGDLDIFPDEMSAQFYQEHPIKTIFID